MTEEISPYSLPSDACDKFFTPPEKSDYEEARERIALQINEAIMNVLPNQPGRESLADFTAMEQEFLIEQATAILNLTWPDGSPMIGVLAKEQTLPTNPYPQMTQCADEDGAIQTFTNPDWMKFHLAENTMLENGFRKIVREEWQG